MPTKALQRRRNDFPEAVDLELRLWAEAADEVDESRCGNVPIADLGRTMGPGLRRKFANDWFAASKCGAANPMAAYTAAAHP